jgi:predicted alpha-1,2-mannosidase
MRKSILLLALLSSIFSFSQDLQSEDLVNPLMGTDSKYSLSNGNTYPAMALPWGMNFWTAQTNKNGDGWQYQYSADKIVGFKQTHQPSPWINDYGCFSIMPMTGKLKLHERERASWFSHKAEVVKPYYYSVYLADADVVTEIAPTERCAIFRFTFPSTDSSFILVDAFEKGSYIKITPEENKIIGYTTRNNGGVPANFKNYFVIECDKPFSYFSVADSSRNVLLQKEMGSYHSYGAIGFKTKKGEQVCLRIASSFISFEQAKLNLKREIGNQNFDAIEQKAKQAWHKQLSKIKVEGGTEEQMKTFYSCLYRVLLFPRMFYEINAAGETVHYSPYNGKIEKGYLFTDNGFWDTFRAVFPFFTLMYPEMNAKMMEGLANTYKESGWLPEWASPGHRDCMIGSNSASLIADSYLKGIRGYDINTLYEAMIKNSNNEGPLSSVGRKGVKQYNELGYVPYNIGIDESAARSLEYGYADFCIAKLGKALERPDDEIALYEKRSMNYKNLFDAKHKLMRGKNADGSFQSPFNPNKWGDAFTEGNSWHYTWSVFHDVNGLMGLMGGRKGMKLMLDSVFNMPPQFDESYYKQVIHEIREMQIMNMGQYAHGNQPIQHMTYLYNYCGSPWKTQMHVREVMDKLYKPTPDGYCGDEDNGQTSAWYVFSAMGFYPVCPGTQEYVLGAPLFKKITLSLANGKQFVIDASGNSSSNKYVQQAKLNGGVWDKNYLNHFDILKGGRFELKMGGKPNYQRGTSALSVPFSTSLK